MNINIHEGSAQRGVVAFLLEEEPSFQGSPSNSLSFLPPLPRGEDDDE
jgi:hypothetical protein